MALYKYLKQIWKNPTDESKAASRERLLKFRREPSTIRIDKPTRLDKARSVGYKAKAGVLLVRQRVMRGGRMRPDIKGARRSKHARQKMILAKNYQQVAEERTARRYPNTEVLNSYYVTKDGKYYWYEVILVDRSHPVVRSSKELAPIAAKKGRAIHGQTSSGKKSRGLRHKGKGAEKMRPSMRAHGRRAN